MPQIPQTSPRERERMEGRSVAYEGGSRRALVNELLGPEKLTVDGAAA